MDTNRLTGEHMMKIGAALATKPGRVHELQLMNNELDAKGGEGIALVLAANGSKIESVRARVRALLRACASLWRETPERRARAAFPESQPSRRRGHERYVRCDNGARRRRAVPAHAPHARHQ